MAMKFFSVFEIGATNTPDICLQINACVLTVELFCSVGDNAGMHSKLTNKRVEQGNTEQTIQMDASGTQNMFCCLTHVVAQSGQEKPSTLNCEHADDQ